jgi:acetylornithine deacetylase/succinyl-diaminopimelate desuccinylase-like protein
VRRVGAVLVAGVALAASCTAPALEVDGKRALARVERQVAFGPRVPGTEAHDAMRQWLVDELTRLGAEVRVQTFRDTVFGEVRDLANVIGRFGPAGGRPILLGAHWDTRWAADQDRERSGEAVPGANDGGSGVAVLFEVAELMARRAPARGVELAFFDAEDQGQSTFPSGYSRGSKAYADSLAPRIADGTAPIAAFVFDMVGDRDLAIYPEGLSVERAANLVSLVLEAARRTGAKHFHDTPRGAIMDDHVPLQNAGIPAVDIIDYDYAAWHTTRDLPDMVSPESLAEVSAVAAWIVYRSPLSRP